MCSLPEEKHAAVNVSETDNPLVIYSLDIWKVCRGIAYYLMPMIMKGIDIGNKFTRTSENRELYQCTFGRKKLSES